MRLTRPPALLSLAAAVAVAADIGAGWQDRPTVIQIVFTLVAVTAVLVGMYTDDFKKKSLMHA